MLYDFLIQFLNQKKRTNTSHARHAITAEAEGRVVNGVKGPSYLSMVADFDIVSGFAADYMHQCLLGVTRYFVIYLWLDSSNHVKTLETSKTIRQMGRDVKLPCEFLYDFRESHLAALDINDLWRKAVYMHVGNDHFLSLLPNQFERD
ncbi:hypothetical protein GQR58_026433 [Nymphon striatum]|nr:hypothetical protein GQR58_026433 [Nymphon striatum]